MPPSVIRRVPSFLVFSIALSEGPERIERWVAGDICFSAYLRPNSNRKGPLYSSHHGNISSRTISYSMSTGHVVDVTSFCLFFIPPSLRSLSTCIFAPATDISVHLPHIAYHFHTFTNQFSLKNHTTFTRKRGEDGVSLNASRVVRAVLMDFVALWHHRTMASTGSMIDLEDELAINSKFGDDVIHHGLACGILCVVVRTK